MMTKKSPSIATTIQDFPAEVLLKIFMCLNIVDLVGGVSHVCTLWRAICRDHPVLWDKINLNNISYDAITTHENRRPVWEVVSSWNLLLILEDALSLGGRNVTKLIFHFKMSLRGEQLLYAAKRTPNLRRLTLPPELQLLQDPKFEEAFEHWKDLESLTLSRASYPNNMFRAIGTHCKNFVELKLKFRLNLVLAKAIVTHIPQLKVLSIWGTMMCTRALVYLLRSLKQLEVLNVSHSNLHEFGKMNDVDVLENNYLLVLSDLELDDEINELTLRLKKLVTCRERFRDCCVCLDVREEFLQWYEYGEETTT